MQKRPKKRVITLTTTFFKSHPKAGQPTNFIENFQKTKQHTIRKNIEYWGNIIHEVNEGVSELHVRYWSGKPYRSKQVQHYTFEAGSQLLGLQRVYFVPDSFDAVVDNCTVKLWELAENDGLSFLDFRYWFAKKDGKMPTKEMALINFTNFRYLPF
jgi:hypothetical protein